ncbi:hypothetical protein AAF712_016271 [Marasmius tenuissimus]|uniref:Uncharacterized protein n=1 Tax=Marasmius tenuissimus TaxID=585030 RepID=A0ABR2Z758_9AGAR
MAAPTTNKKPAISKSLIQKYNTTVPIYTEIKRKTKGSKSCYVLISPAERLQRHRECRMNAQAIQKAIAAIRAYIRDECFKLGKKYKRKQWYFLDMVYQGSIQLTKPANSPNNFNMLK